MTFQMEYSTLWFLVTALLLSIWLLRRHSSSCSTLKHIPTVSYSPYLPAFINRLIYYPDAASLIYRGYKQCKDCPFRLLTADGDVIVLPVKYLDELRNLPSSVISSLDAQFENALGDYTNILVQSALPSATVRRRLTPSLSRIIPWVVDELRYAFDIGLPECEDHWASVKPHEMFVHLIARATSRVVAGESLRRNETWLNTASSYSVNVGITIFLLRPVPKFLRPLVAPFLHSVRQMKKQLHYVRDELFVPMIQERRANEQFGDVTYVKPDDFLQWMMDMADTEEDRDPRMLAHHMLLLMTLAVVHTSSMALCHALYDLLVMPEYIEPLREEIKRTLSEGWENASQASFNAQRRLDSFLRESQRFNPPGELSFHRIVKQPLTLSDNLVLPNGTHICFPAGPMSKDADYLPNPEVFDGFRWCQDLQDRHAIPTFCIPASSPFIADGKPAQSFPSSSAASFVSITPANMHFGFGRQACPGRFFAANTIKAILSRIILDYEFRLEDGSAGRPKNVVVGEHIIPNSSAKVLFKKRSIGL